MTVIYFVRHAEPDYSNHNDVERPLTEKGLSDRRLDSVWIEDIESFFVRQWGDFSYKLNDGEALGEVQQRNIVAPQRVLERYSGQNIVIGTHGTELSTIINYYDSGFGYEQFCEIKGLMPWIVRMEFNGTELFGIQKYNLFE